MPGIINERPPSGVLNLFLNICFVKLKNDFLGVCATVSLRSARVAMTVFQVKARGAVMRSRWCSSAAFPASSSYGIVPGSPRPASGVSVLLGLSRGNGVILSPHPFPSFFFHARQAKNFKKQELEEKFQ